MYRSIFFSLNAVLPNYPSTFQEMSLTAYEDQLAPLHSTITKLFYPPLPAHSERDTDISSLLKGLEDIRIANRSADDSTVEPQSLDTTTSISDCLSVRQHCSRRKNGRRPEGVLIVATEGYGKSLLIARLKKAYPSVVFDRSWDQTVRLANER